MNKEKLFEYYNGHKGEVIGAGIGLLFGLCVLFLGFIKIIFIAICVFAGYHLGKMVFRDKNYLRNVADKILRFFNI